MSQHDMDLLAGNGAAFRADLNLALKALASNNSGATEPATPYAHMWWPDTAAGIMKQRNSANTAWLNRWQLSGGELATLAALQLQSATHCGTTGGTSTAFTAAATPAIGANAANTRIRAKLHTAPTGSPTLNVNGIGGLSIVFRNSSGALSTVTAKQAPAGWVSDFEIDSTATYWVMLQTALPSVSQTIEATRAMDAASGDVSYTLDFQPRVIMITAIVSGNSGISEGWSDGTTENCNFKFGGAATVQNDGGNTIIYFSPDAAGADVQEAIVKSIDASGFTLTYTRTGTTSSSVIKLIITAFP